MLLFFKTFINKMYILTKYANNQYTAMNGKTNSFIFVFVSIFYLKKKLYHQMNTSN